jgi:subtilase family serine protease
MKKTPAQLLAISFAGGILAAATLAFAASRPPQTTEATSKTETKPDLVVTQIKVDANSTAAKNNVKVKYEIKNQGKGTAAPSTAQVKLLSADGKEMAQSTQHSIPSIAPGQCYTTELTYTMNKKGEFKVKAVTDYNNKLNESNENNNHNTVGVSLSFGL